MVISIGLKPAVTNFITAGSTYNPVVMSFPLPKVDIIAGLS
jgi:hypothetical protein